MILMAERIIYRPNGNGAFCRCASPLRAVIATCRARNLVTLKVETHNGVGGIGKKSGDLAA